MARHAEPDVELRAALPLLHTPLHGSKKDNVQPRLAATYALGDKTVLRGEYGIFVGPGQGEHLIQPIESDRVSTTLSTGQFLAFPVNQDCWSRTSRTTRTTAATSHAPTHRSTRFLKRCTSTPRRCSRSSAMGSRRRSGTSAARAVTSSCAASSTTSSTWSPTPNPASATFHQMDFFFAKQFSTGARSNVEFRLEMFNMFNTTNFANPSGTLNAAIPGSAGQANTLQPGEAYTAAAAGPAFGRLTGTIGRTVGLGTPRQVQLALRFQF